jgi:hypothetical protein
MMAGYDDTYFFRFLSDKQKGSPSCFYEQEVHLIRCNLSLTFRLIL